MIIRRPRQPELRLGYEMNAHPAASLEQFRAALDRYTIPISERIAPDALFGIVPHIGEGLSQELRRAEVRSSLREYLTGRGLFPFSVNAFPLRDFHQERVKEQVYLPSWAHHRRADLTNRIADQLSDLVPKGEPATISTLGGAYRPTGHGLSRQEEMAKNYLRTVVHLAKLERQQGTSIVLAVEPEPDTTFEVAEDVTLFLEKTLIPTAKFTLPRELGISPCQVEETLFRYFTVNIDVCHAAVMFRDPVEEWRALEGAGLRIAKLHLTNALAIPHPGEDGTVLTDLLRYDEPRYLHQVVGRKADGSLWRGADLSAVKELSKRELLGIEELRVHFHVPLSKSEIGPLKTTRTETASALEHALQHRDPPHLVIETYTWPYLSQREAEQANLSSEKLLLEGIESEFRWVLDQFDIED